MARRSTAGRYALALGFAGAIAIGCANGGGSSDLDAFADGGEAGTGSSGSGSGSSSGSASSSSGGTSSSGSTSSSGAAQDSGGGQVDSGSSSGTQDGGGDDGSTTGDDGGGSTCGVSPDQCTTNATFLGSVAGDESGTPVGASGFTSEWLRLDETEQDSSPVGQAMIFTATLTSPPGMNYDLYAYLGASGGVGNIECKTIKAQSTNPAGEPDQVTFQWGESTGGIANGEDDSATVMIEVVWVSGACTNTQNWSLSAHGD